ncbi:CocE/NonD family hydrolase [Streptomyces thermolineatus]|uniref:CocE/NonD family hydrolase n=1 Tax=Streptomyces thermolineatus TaxID=44033 RepID=UPI00384F7B65
MRSTRSRRIRSAAAGTLTAALLATAAVGAAAPAATAATASTTASTSSATFEFVDIPGSGGITLKGNVFTPGDYDGTRTYPMVVLPSSWSLNDLEYIAQAKKLADSGYVVVSYTSRGFWLSGGEIEVAGPEDVADISKVIDWALANTPADEDRIGMAGISYGAGLSLMGAAFDERVKAVVALSGWADLVESLFTGRTQKLQASLMLGGSGYLTGRPGDELKTVLGDFLAGRYDKEAELRAWGKERSPATHVDRINANGTAVMMGNAWGDSLFPPDQLGAFYEKLEGPKRLEFRPGDHATAEATGLFGLPNDVWQDGVRWLDHHLKGADNGIDAERPVRLKSRTGGGYEGYASWSALATEHKRLPLGRKGWLLGTGELGVGAEADWSTGIGTNLDSGANGGIIFLSNLADQLVQQPPSVSVPLLPRTVSAVWQSEKYGTAQRVRGSAKLHTTVTPSDDRGTLMAYLYDVDSLGTGKLVTHSAFTFTDRTPGRPFTLDLDLTATSYDVPAGHRLALVVDTVDPLYLEHNALGTTLTFSSTAADPSWLSVPLDNR